MCPHIKQDPFSGRSYCEVIMEFGEAVCEKSKRTACLQAVTEPVAEGQSLLASWMDEDNGS